MVPMLYFSDSGHPLIPNYFANPNDIELFYIPENYNQSFFGYHSIEYHNTANIQLSGKLSDRIDLLHSINQ